MPERKAAERVAETKHRASVAKLRGQWGRSGFDPRGHLAVTSVDGSRDVLIDFGAREHRNPNRIAAWMVQSDISDVLNAVWKIERDKRVAAAAAETKALW